MKLETSPEGKEELVTLAMVGGAENAARRPCFMGGSPVGAPMARLTTSESPKGFWPHPDEEYFTRLRLPPGKYQRRENLGGVKPDFMDLNQIKQ